MTGTEGGSPEQSSVTKWLRAVAPAALGALALVAVRFLLPEDGWGQYARWALNGAFIVVLLLWVAYAVGEFRRGYAGDESHE